MSRSDRLTRVLRLAQLGLARAGARASDALRRKAEQLEIRLDAVRDGLDIRPIEDVPVASVDLLGADDPISTIMSRPEFAQTTAFFAHNPATARSLISPQAQALLHTVVRNLRPRHAVEIGTFKAGTTEAICRALHANGQGMLHTVDPFRTEYIAATLKQFPPPLMGHVSAYPNDSMAFYKDMESRNIQPDLIFVDGNHDYEFALFDISFGARHISRSGFIFVDNITQPGPFLAACDFLAASPGWREHGRTASAYDRSKSYDRERTTIPDTDFMVLRAPAHYLVGARPWNVGRTRRFRNGVNGVRLSLASAGANGTLDIQVVLRGFGAMPAECLGEARIDLRGAAGDISVPLPSTLKLNGVFAYFTVEPWLIWQGDHPLALSRPPEPY